MTAIERKSMLYKTKVDYTNESGDQVNGIAMNHALGCPHGCLYPCYAMGNAKRWGQVGGYADWVDVKPVSNALALLHRELSSRRDVERVHLCFTTDPFPYAPAGGTWPPALAEVHATTMAACSEINAHGIPVTVLTKGELPAPAQGGLASRCGGCEEAWAPVHPLNCYGISLVSDTEGFREAWEPGAAPFAARVASLEALHGAGMSTWASLEPFPALTPEGMERLYGPPTLETDIDWAGFGEDGETAARGRLMASYGVLARCLSALSFCDRIVFGRWNYNASMPTDVGDVDGWYAGAASLVRRYCASRGIECVVKRGTDRQLTNTDTR